jgi:hypothetical protein
MATKKTALSLAPDPRVTALKSRATKLLKNWQAAEVADTPSFEAAGLAVKDAVLIRKDLKSLLDPEIRAAKADYDAKRKVFKDVDSVIESAEDSIRDALSAYAARQREAQEKLVTKALESGKDEKAAAIAARPFVPEVQGLSFTEHWHAEGNDIAALAKAVAEGKVSSEALSFNLVWLNAMARSLKDNMAIPGVAAVKETSSNVRT